MSTEPSPEAREKGEKLLNAVERILAEPDEINAIAQEIYMARLAENPERPTRMRERACEDIIERYAGKTALGGGLSSLPAFIPGVGTVAAVLGGGLADMTVCLKYETEMILCLASCYGHDIREPKERQYALLLAGLSTYSEVAGENAAVDYLSVGGTAIWEFAPRQLSKLLTTVFANLALSTLTRGLLKSIPIAGAVAGYAMNKTLTKRAGAKAVKALDEREYARRSS